MNLGLAGKLALVTGASQGIGRAIALTLMHEGAFVVAVARSKPSGLTVPWSGDGGHVIHATLDLTAPDTVAAMATLLATSAVSPPDIIVHNLGGSLSGSDDYEAVWRFNVGIAKELNDVFVPQMQARSWGRVVHLSTLSTKTHNGYPAYVAAKCALEGYVKTLARSVAKDGVVVTAVAPGAIYTEGRHFAKLSEPELATYYDRHLPTRRLGTAQDVASVVAFLCSEQAGFMAGAIVPVDGGGY